MATAKKNRTPQKTANTKSAVAKKKSAAAPPAAAPPAAAPPAAAPQKDKNWKKYQDVFKKVTVMAKCPGVEGEISVTLVEVEFEGEKHRVPTRKEAQIWLRGKRKAKSDEAKKEREATKQQRELERAAKIAPYITEKLEKIAEQIAGLHNHAAVADDERTILEGAVEALRSVVDIRSAKEAAKEDKKSA